MGTPRSKLPLNIGDKNSPQAQQANALVLPRLFNLNQTAAYLGVSVWTVRDLEAAGILARVRVPLPNRGELRKLLFDRDDLDQLIDVWKDRLSSTQ